MSRVEEASDAGEVICLPELSARRFRRTKTLRRLIAEPVPGRRPRRSARGQRRKVTVVCRCSSACAGCITTARPSSGADGGIAGLYRKMHLPDDPALEKYYVTPGDRGFRILTPGRRIATLICWDKWYPRGARLAALQGSEASSSIDGDRLAPARESAIRAASKTPGGRCTRPRGQPSRTACTSAR